MPLSHDECLQLLEKIRWNGEPTYPYCGSKKYRKLKNEHRYQYNKCLNTSKIEPLGSGSL
ncbi:transposase [Candidatus Albibeggiatoa sp. nov. NOAA]|uniref:transposase n=1 Tax=Candidatus Albibeggiatoa sp. nov. NOAA TaxID=3162724 RepID=UPI00333EA448